VVYLGNNPHLGGLPTGLPCGSLGQLDLDQTCGGSGLSDEEHLGIDQVHDPSVGARITSLHDLYGSSDALGPIRYIETTSLPTSTKASIMYHPAFLLDGSRSLVYGLTICALTEQGGIRDLWSLTRRAPVT
jgi:hypothetical protein